MDVLKGPLLPFKGKGELHQRIDRLTRECEILDQRMRSLCTQFKTTFHATTPVHLAVRNIRGCLYLEWRVKGSKGRGQSFIDLCGKDQGRTILTGLSESVRPVYLDYERQRLELSLAYRLRYHELRMLREHLSGLDHLATYARNH
jgi:hypothetical protein